MGRYTGPTEKLSRREGVELFLKGERLLNGKSGLERRPTPPGQHGAARRRQPSTYGVQLREKQRAKRYYGVRERQFRRYVREASRQREGLMGDHLLRLLERRLDNVVYRLGLATTRAQARQYVNHGHVMVDGGRVDIPSFQVKAGQTVALRTDSPVEPAVRDAVELVASVPGWLQADVDALQGKVLRLPDRSEIATPVNEQLIVEFYSRV
ncbi:30S ribosomal protein S4 [Svornostia abyssi]|uniref:Small ribosomal subunit protein uS4 n=1 Tax=Svornostia abyssi TaxID=2898438 RepID=A0ABY5PNU1_9ACTN|nr:30S ribosomal protein S4 [Parviterribacteraceae bacterium J379]